MQFATQGATSSRDDVTAAQMSVASSGGQYRYRFVYFAKALDDLRRNGMSRERRKWIATANPNVFVYTGDIQGGQFSGTHVRIWAAVEVDASGVLRSLLRVMDGYRGDRIDYANLETEAVQRLNGGRIP